MTILGESELVITYEILYCPNFNELEMTTAPIAAMKLYYHCLVYIIIFQRQ